LDDNTKKIIEHGKRIRICLKQTELLHLSVSQQLVVLLALTSGLFDPIAPEKIEEAESALLSGNAGFPDDLLKRLSSDKELSKEDQAAILKIAGNILAPFRDKPQPDQTNK
jgi:F-type H+-transporting ATPase subunit alpha